MNSKFITAILISVLSFKVEAQIVLSFDSVLVFEGKTKDRLYLLSKLFLAENFKSSKEVIQIDDKESGLLMGKGNYDYEFSKPRFTCTVGNGKGIVEFSVKIEIKDGKIRLKLSDFNHSSTDPNVNLGVIYKDEKFSDGGGALEKCRKDVHQEIQKKSENLFLNFIEKIKRDFSKEVESSDW